MFGRTRQFAGMMLLGLVWATGCQQRGQFAGGVVQEGTHTALATAGDIQLADVQEVDLVEAMAQSRQDYEQRLRALVTYYNGKGFRHKAIWAERELEDVKLVKTYRYLVDAEIPGAMMRPTHSIAAADALYEDGVNYMKQGGWHGLPLIYDKVKLKKAIEKFNQIIREYPNSDKIDDAAFYAAELYKEYFNDDLRAVQYYQRVWEWNPETEHPARFQAAVIYDYRLHDRDRALELYQQVLEHEQFNRSNVRFSAERIKQLTNNLKEPTPAEPADA